jgi:hypothetical protein
MRAAVCLLTVIAAVLAAGSAVAHTYKWVDERGVTNYSNVPPPKLKGTTKVVQVEERISAYTPDKAALEAYEAARRNNERALSDRISSLERELDAERRARMYAGGADLRALQAAYDQCVADRRVDCNGIRSGTYPYVPVVIFAPPFRRPLVAPIFPVNTGSVIAGNFTVGNNVTAGNFTTFIASRPGAGITSRGWR